MIIVEVVVSVPLSADVYRHIKLSLASPRLLPRALSRCADPARRITIRNGEREGIAQWTYDTGSEFAVRADARAIFLEQKWRGSKYQAKYTKESTRPIYAHLGGGMSHTGERVKVDATCLSKHLHCE